MLEYVVWGAKSFVVFVVLGEGIGVGLPLVVTKSLLRQLGEGHHVGRAQVVVQVVQVFNALGQGLGLVVAEDIDGLVDVELFGGPQLVLLSIPDQILVEALSIAPV